MSDYHINIFHGDEDGGYIADIPGLDSCSVFGATPEEALTAVEIARDVWLTRRATPGERSRPLAIVQRSIRPSSKADGQETEVSDGDLADPP